MSLSEQSTRLTTTLSRLRALRDRCNAIHASFETDVTPFLVADRTFVRLPNQAAKKDTSTATTATGLMATVLAGDEDVSIVYGKGNGHAGAKQAFDRVMDAPWDSAGLSPDNAFTSVLVIRASSFLSRARGFNGAELLDHVRGDVRDTEGKPTRWSKCRLREIITTIADGVHNSLEIERPKYPATAAFGYWLVDGVDRFGVTLKAQTWQLIAQWIADFFRRQVSLISASEDSLKDPIALGMAAALIKRLRSCCEAKECRIDEHEKVAQVLPTAVEVRHAVRLFMSYQNPQSGTWPKFFPLFHFPEGGANYCLSFEVLEALLHEFRDDDLFREQELLATLERTMTWIEATRLGYSAGANRYHGWNSGSDIASLQAGMPELWTTGVVHMFERRLHLMVSELIREELKQKYRATAPPVKGKDFIDIDITVQGEETTVGKLIKEEIITPWRADSKPDKRPSRSALLFGPPGTSKTRLVRGVASELEWYFIEITPSQFVSEGLPNIYSRANEIFDDLKDLRNVVIFFDEMDALTRTRQQGTGSQPLDVTQQFLTTSMLPKLAMLHDETDNVFFMATNHRRDFDDAIVRPGRFDLLIFMPPPKWKQKLERIGDFWGPHEDATVDQVRTLLTAWVDNSVAEKLDLFTYAELGFLFANVLRKAQHDKFPAAGDMYKVLNDYMKKDGFLELVAEWWGKYIALREKLQDNGSNPLLEEFRQDAAMSRRQ